MSIKICRTEDEFLKLSDSIANMIWYGEYVPIEYFDCIIYHLAKFNVTIDEHMYESELFTEIIISHNLYETTENFNCINETIIDDNNSFRIFKYNNNDIKIKIICEKLNGNNKYKFILI